MENIIRFVRQVLGCECPAEMYRHVESTYGIPLGNGITLRNRINIGNRLLVYVVAAESGPFVKKALAELVKAGRDERDRKGFNRFRLVLASRDPQGIKEVAKRTFVSLPCRDEKIHLHIVELSAVSTLEWSEPAGSLPPPVQF